MCYIFNQQNVEKLYQQALSMEPDAIEVMNQYAQYASMMGDMPKAIELLKSALNLARTKDDVQDLNQVNLLLDCYKLFDQFQYRCHIVIAFFFHFSC